MSNIKNSRLLQIASHTCGLGAIVCCLPAQADAMTPTLAIMAIPMWLSLLIIIPLEAKIAQRILKNEWKASLKLSAIANAVSTLLGIPLTYAVMVGTQLILWNQIDDFLHEILKGASNRLGPKIVELLLTAPWLLPDWRDMYWMLPCAILLLCVPFFLISVWSENIAGRFCVPAEQKPLIIKWSWQANIVSYGLMFLVTLLILAANVIEHNVTMNSEEYRDVDLMSADKLWQMAVTNTEKARKRKYFQHYDPWTNAHESPHAKVQEYRAAGRYRDAEQLLENYIKEQEPFMYIMEYPNYATVGPFYLDLGNCYLDDRQLDKAEHCLKMAFRGSTHLSEAAASYASLLEKEGKKDLAVTWRERADQSKKSSL